MAANPELLVVALLAESDAFPLVTAKLTATFACGTPKSRASTISGTASVAPCPIHRVGVSAARSSAVEVPTTVACCDCGGEYTAGASAIVIVLVPVAVGVTPLEDSPASSVSTEQEEAPLHAENCRPLVALQAIVAPLTGVTPSAATARTRMGLAAAEPTGVAGSAPCNRNSRSVARAPQVSAPVIWENAPLAGSVTRIVAVPSCAAAGMAAWIWVAEADRVLPLFPAAVTFSPGLNPVPLRVVTPPARLRRAGVTVSE